MTEADAVASSPGPITRTSLVADLSALGVRAGSVLMVHSSLSSLGWVVGGAQTVVEALLDVVGPDGTIVMPTQTGQLTDPALWSNPPIPDEWVDEVRANMPVFDPALTPTRAMGQIVEVFRHVAGVVRSPHPTVSFAACGPSAHQVCSEHPLTNQFGETSPLARMYELDATVLLLGVGHGNNTSLHLAETRAEWPSKSLSADCAKVMVDGVATWVDFDELRPDESDFDTIGDAFAATGRQIQGRVGQATALLMRQRDIVDFGVGWISANRR